MFARARGREPGRMPELFRGGLPVLRAGFGTRRWLTSASIGEWINEGNGRRGGENGG